MKAKTETMEERAERWFKFGMTVRERLDYLWERYQAVQKENAILKQKLHETK